MTEGKESIDELLQIRADAMAFILEKEKFTPTEDNLAVYAAVHCPQRVRRRIDAVWSNDGPGFHGSLLDLPGRQGLEGCIHTIVPKSSVVGMLLEHEENYDVVDSDQLGLLQHDGFSWQVQGDHFLHLREVTRQAQLSDRELRQWVREIPLEQRERFTEALFAVLSASGASPGAFVASPGFTASIFRAMQPTAATAKSTISALPGPLVLIITAQTPSSDATM